MSWYDPRSWTDPFEDVYDAGKSAVDAAAKAAKDAVGAAEVLGEGIVDGAEMIGEGIVDGAVMIGNGVVTAGEGAVKWSVSASGDAIDWSKTSFAEVSEWTENAAGDVANFALDTYHDARDAVVSGAVWIYEQIANLVAETLPELGPLDPQAREAAAWLLTAPVVDGIQSLADAAGCVITFGVKVKGPVTADLGVYACGDGWGFFFGSGFDAVHAIIHKASAGVGAQVTMVFGPVSRASGAKAIKLGLGMNATPAKSVGFTIGGVVLMEATMPPLFLGVRYAMDLDVSLFKTSTPPTPEQARTLTWSVKVQKPMPNGDFVVAAGDVAGEVGEIGWEQLTNGLSTQATHFDAALRAQADPSSADRVESTALAAALSPFKPRYYGEIRTAAGQTVIGTDQGELGLDLAGERRVVQLVAGLTDPSCVSFEAVGEPPLYWCAGAGGELKLVPYDESLDLSGTTFRMVRGVAGKGVSFAVAADGPNNPRFLCATQVFGGVVLPAPRLLVERLVGIEAPSKQDATFLLDRATSQPAAASSILRPGECLRVDEFKRAPNGMFSLVLAADGRLAMRRRGSAPLGSPTSWIVYEPGIIQDEVLLWAWASPAPAAPGPYHAVVTDDGRIAVRAGADPSQAGATLWQSEVHGAPGPCFLAVTNQGVVTLVRGTPEAPGELVWSSPSGAIYWPTRRRQVVIGGESGLLHAMNGGGVHDPQALTQPPAEPVRLDAQRATGWTAFELQELCTGHVALRAQGRRFVGAQDDLTLTCLRDQVGPHELFTLEPLGPSDGPVRLKSAFTGKYISLYQPPVPIPGVQLLRTDGPHAAAAVALTLVDVEHDFTAHSGRLVHLVAKHSGKALEVMSGYDHDGVRAVQGEFLGADHQKWALTHAGDGWFSLVNHHTGKALDIQGAQQQDGAAALQWAPGSGDNQRFSLTPTSDGHYLIRAKHSGRALAVEAASQAAGARVQQRSVDGGDHQRWKVTLAPPGRSSPWTPLGGGLASPPSIASWGPGRLDVFARGLEGAIYQKWSEGAFKPWVGHGGGFFGEPCAVAQGPGRLDVFARGQDSAIYQRWWDGSQWHGWASLGGGAVASPVALAPRPGRWDIFVLAPDKAIWHRYADNGWSPWLSLGGGLRDPPAAVWRDHRYDLFARGLDDCLYQKTWQGGGWSGWIHRGGSFKGRFSAVSPAPGCLDVFGRGNDDKLWHHSLRDGAWSSRSLDGVLTSDPVACSAAPDRVDVFVRGTDEALWHRRLTSGGWLPWARLGLKIVGAPAVTSSAPGQVDLAVLHADQSLWYHRMNG